MDVDAARVAKVFKIPLVVAQRLVPTAVPMGSRHVRASVGDAKAGMVAGLAGALDPDDILTPEEVAKRLKVPKRWVYEKTRQRCPSPIPCFRIGKYIRFSWRIVSQWVLKTENRHRGAA